MAADKGNAQNAVIVGIMGSTGCGKSTYLKQRLTEKSRKRTLIWSPKEDIDHYAAFYTGSVIVSTATEFLNVAKGAGASGAFHAVYRPRLNRKIDTAQFDAVCKIAKVVRNLTVVAEELHTVTLPAWSPDGWQQLTMMGRAYGVEVFGLSQRPASVDKAFFGNLSLLHAGRMNFEEDQKTMAKALHVPLADVQNLVGYDWIERDILSGKVTRSKK